MCSHPLSMGGELCCRDDARTVYVAMVAELGAQYLKFAISVLRSALPPRGYMGHVQGYTVHAVLQAVMQVLLHSNGALP